GRRQRPVPSSGRGGHRGFVPDRSDRATGEGCRAPIREARRTGRHHRQRRRSCDVDPRRGEAGGGGCRQLPRRRWRRERRGHGDLARGDPLGPERPERPREHLRRDHAVRPGRAGDSGGARTREPAGADRGAARRHERGGGAADPRRGEPPEDRAGRHDARGRRACGRARARGGCVAVAILVDEGAKVVVAGITGSEGTFHSLRNRSYGTDVVAGVTPGKGGQDVEGIPVFDTVEDAVEATGANTSLIFVPARFAAEAIYEAADAGVGLVVCITEGIPVRDMAQVGAYLRGTETVLVGPNCPGVISPGRANVGIIPGEICAPGRVGLVSRSGTLTYQIVHELTQLAIGQSTCVGMGGDPVHGIGFIGSLERFEADDETDLVVMIGEIGGDDEERAAAVIADRMIKPVVSYIAGFTAPPGKRMGHAGAIITGSGGTAAAKAEALEAAGVGVGRTPTEVAGLVRAALS